MNMGQQFKQLGLVKRRLAARYADLLQIVRTKIDDRLARLEIISMSVVGNLRTHDATAVTIVGEEQRQITPLGFINASAPAARESREDIFASFFDVNH